MGRKGENFHLFLYSKKPDMHHLSVEGKCLEVDFIIIINFI